MGRWGPAWRSAGPVLESKRLIDHAWMRLRCDRLRDTAGVAHERAVFEYPDWVDVIALTAEFDIVLVDQYRHPVRQVRTEFPAGAVDENELPLQAIQRELREETGYVSDDWHLLASAPVNPAWQGNLIHSYLALNARRSAEQDLDQGEVIRARLLPLPDFIALVEDGRLELPALQLAGLYLLQQFLRRAGDPALEEFRARAAL